MGPCCSRGTGCRAFHWLQHRLLLWVQQQLSLFMLSYLGW
jgi:hypothetical protein